MQIIETPRLLMRAFTEDDAPAFMPLLNDPEVTRYTNDPPCANVEEVLERMRGASLRDYRVHGYGRHAVIEKSTGRLIGFSGLKYLEDIQEIDVGYRFIKDCWGKGYATESARAVMDDGITRMGMRRIIGMVVPGNHASVNVLRKLGLREDGRRVLEFAGQNHELDMFLWEAS